jgi:preprotein translocase subunit SecD
MEKRFMNRRQYRWLFLIIPLIALAIWVDLSKQITIPNPFNSQTNLVDRNVQTQLGLDLRGGLQTLLEADVPAGTSISSSDLNVTRQILESRANALGGRVPRSAGSGKGCGLSATNRVA